MVIDWDHSMLKQGAGAYTCMPTPPDIRAKGGREPMCLDKVWEAWGDAWMNKKPFEATGGLSTDPHNGGPYVMWKGTPYAHIMIPVADRPKQ